MRPMVAPVSSVVQVSLTEIIFFTLFSFVNWLTILSSLSNSPFALNIFMGHVKVLTFIATDLLSLYFLFVMFHGYYASLENPVWEFLKQFPSIIKDYPSPPPGTLPSPGRLCLNSSRSLRATPAEAGGARQSLYFQRIMRLPLGRELGAERLRSSRLRGSPSQSRSGRVSDCLRRGGRGKGVGNE